MVRLQIVEIDIAIAADQNYCDEEKEEEPWLDLEDIALPKLLADLLVRLIMLSDEVSNVKVDFVRVDL